MQMNKIKRYKLPEGRSLGLKVVLPGGAPESDNAPKEFKGWNLELGGTTEAPDWDPEINCERGLHVWAWAQGSLWQSDIWYRDGVIWLAVEYETTKAVSYPVGVCVKIPEGRTVAVGETAEEIVAFIKAHIPLEARNGLFLFDKCIIPPNTGVTAILVGEGGRAETGDGGEVIVGDFSSAVAGHGGSAKAGYWGYAEAGVDGIAIARNRGTARVGDGGTAEAGNEGIAFVMGGGGCAIVGDYGHAYAGAGGTAMGGHGSQVSVGIGGKAKAREYGKLTFAGSSKTFFVGMPGILPDTFYRLGSDDTLLEVS